MYTVALRESWWWWCEEAQKIARIINKEKFKKYTTAKKVVKRVVCLIRYKTYDSFYNKLYIKDGEKD